MGSNGRIGKVIEEVQRILQSVKCYTFGLIDLMITPDTQIKMGRVITLTMTGDKQKA